MMIATYNLGIGNCWIDRAKEEVETEEGKNLLKLLGIKGNYREIGYLEHSENDEQWKLDQEKKTIFIELVKNRCNRSFFS